MKIMKINKNDNNNNDNNDDNNNDNNNNSNNNSNNNNNNDNNNNDNYNDNNNNDNINNNNNNNNDNNNIYLKRITKSNGKDLPWDPLEEALLYYCSSLSLFRKRLMLILVRRVRFVRWAGLAMASGSLYAWTVRWGYTTPTPTNTYRTSTLSLTSAKC